MLDRQKQITLGMIGLAILVLIVTVVWQPGQLGFKDDTDYAELQRQAEIEAQAYSDLLASMDPNYQASQQLLEKIATQEIVREQIEQTLDVGQRLEFPVIENQDLKISQRTDQGFVQNYVSDLSSMVQNYNQDISSANQQLYSDGADNIALTRAEAATNNLVDSLKSIEVPEPAVEMHKAQIATYSKYARVFESAKQYARGETQEPWANLYGNYAVIENRINVVNNEASKLALNYNLSDQQIAQFTFVKTAQAQFGTVIVGADIPGAVLQGIKAGLAKAFANFSIQMIDKLVAHIEKNFAIASQLYYSNELGRFYSVEYMQKFVADPLDQDIIQKFLPQYFCINTKPGELKQIFEAKARENLGSDIVINPSDPDFYQKLARLGGDERNYPSWWESYYQGLAAQTQAEAQAAANKEVLSPGLKSARDLVNSQVVKTVSAISGVQEAAIKGVFNLGTNNTENIVSQLVAGVTENLVNKFVFTGLVSGQSSGGGGIGLIKETNVCLQTPQLKPVVPVAQSTYDNPDSSSSTTDENLGSN
ncbi:MAG: hypothetical protein R3B41_03360 [Candidatus Doudnabacteria bacterium]